MRYNISFSVTKNKITENKFEVVSQDFTYDKNVAMRFLEKKYKGSKIKIKNIAPTITAIARTL